MPWFAARSPTLNWGRQRLLGYDRGLSALHESYYQPDRGNIAIIDGAFLLSANVSLAYTGVGRFVKVGGRPFGMTRLDRGDVHRSRARRMEIWAGVRIFD